MKGGEGRGWEDGCEQILRLKIEQERVIMEEWGETEGIAME